MMKRLKEYLKSHGKQFYEELIKMPCVVCNHRTPHRIVNRETKQEYPLCLECRSKGYYNKTIFDPKDYREEYKN